MKCSAFLLLCAILPFAPLPARTIAGVDLPDSVQIDGRALPLIAAGAHRQFTFKIYAAAFYFAGKDPAPRQLIDTTDTVVFRTHYTMSIPHGLLVDGVRKHFKKNPDAASFPGEVDLFIRGYERAISPGDIVEVRWRGGTTELLCGGKVTARIPGLAFKKMLFASWFDPRSSDEDFLVECFKPGLPVSEPRR